MENCDPRVSHPRRVTVFIRAGGRSSRDSSNVDIMLLHTPLKCSIVMTATETIRVEAVKPEWQGGHDKASKAEEEMHHWTALLHGSAVLLTPLVQEGAPFRV